MSKELQNLNRKLRYLNDVPTIGLEIIDFICGDFLGSGIHREVYDYNLDPKYVVKIDISEECGDNSIEWRIWNNVMHTTDGTKNWFAPCSWISTNGRIMLQRKTKPLYDKFKNIPEKIPAYFTDIKPDNFGWIGNQIVAHDYAYCLERFGYFALNKKMQPFKKIVSNY